ncbi:nucleotidyl transferase AbiEii/AbiGii toxin family protein [Streptomonospora sp. PA3]|uniref:nucleotidyl transferase AbiEii/AbiGii toxin family protein n=1 Tax=Streptomonospora sp. PA3 TaxID=2607326 RepID=UPI0012DCD12A|nr:nucleotidyl transferase AbiEii/AbiGii toxin family protein [Streptomonospora sp. PA3]MUL42910.1 nucleotidyl transferase AbiEii/AbiGii toxin family protein [Streptomonospora sp. PA3]
MSDAFDPAEEFWRALQDSARDAAEANGTSPSEEITDHVYNRLIARVFTAGADGWMTDGGRSLVLRYPGSRTTTDLDVSSTAEGGRDRVVADFLRAASTDLGDFVRFEVASTETFTTPPGAQVDFAVTCGGKPVDGISVDIVLSPPLSGAPDTRPLPPPLVSVGTAVRDPGVRVRPLLDQMANKIGGLFIHWDGLPPTRAKDLADILLMAANEDFSGRELHRATHTEFARIRERGNILHVPPRFEVPDASWEQRYAKAVSRVPGCPQRTLDEALPVARALLDPLLRADPPDADWDHRRGRWVGPAEDATRAAPRAQWRSGADVVALDTPSPGLPRPASPRPEGLPEAAERHRPPRRPQDPPRQPGDPPRRPRR